MVKIRDIEDSLPYESNTHRLRIQSLLDRCSDMAGGYCQGCCNLELCGGVYTILVIEPESFEEREYQVAELAFSRILVNGGERAGLSSREERPDQPCNTRGNSNKKLNKSIDHTYTDRVEDD
jgi:hypothetical protein